MLPQVQKRRSAQTHQRRSSATPKHAEHVEEDAGPSSPASPPQQMTDDAQPDQMQMEASQDGAIAGSPPGQTLDMQADIEPPGKGQNREAPQTLVSRITRFAGIFTGRKSTHAVQTGKHRNLLHFCNLTSDFERCTV